MSRCAFWTWLTLSGCLTALIWEHPGIWIPMAIGGFFGAVGTD